MYEEYAQCVLYRYTLIEDTGELAKMEITNYVKRTLSPYRNKYSFKYRDPQTGLMKEVKEEYIDKFRNHKLYTFDLDEKEVREVIRKFLIKKMDDAYKESEKQRYILQRFMERYND